MTSSFQHDCFNVSGRQLNEAETNELIAAAIFMHIRRTEQANEFINQDRLGMSLDMGMSLDIRNGNESRYEEWE